MYYNQLVTMTKLNTYLYFAVVTVGRSRKRPAPEAINNLMLVALNPPVAITGGATPRKPATNKGKGKIVEPKKLEAPQLRISGALKIGVSLRLPSFEPPDL
jgi:hypothetical protein